MIWISKNTKHKNINDKYQTHKVQQHQTQLNDCPNKASLLLMNSAENTPTKVLEILRRSNGAFLIYEPAAGLSVAQFFPWIHHDHDQIQKLSSFPQQKPQDRNEKAETGWLPSVLVNL